MLTKGMAKACDALLNEAHKKNKHVRYDHPSINVVLMTTFYSILLDYQSLYGHEREDESGLSSCDLLGSDAGTVPPDDPLH